jgi:hypothetical protein
MSEPCGRSMAKRKRTSQPLLPRLMRPLRERVETRSTRPYSASVIASSSVLLPLPMRPKMPNRP